MSRSEGRNPQPVRVYAEIGAKRAFVGALDWPGWCRRGRDEAAAVEALLTYAPRYRAVLAGSPALLDAFPDLDTLDVAGVDVADRVKGDASTDFGVASRPAPGDERPLTTAELARQIEILDACWSALDRVVESARDLPLATGPRGGGRSLDAIRSHVIEAESAYLRRVDGEVPPGAAGGDLHSRDATRAAARAALRAAAPIGSLPPGPRGGARWSARYSVRRVAWHTLDHAWEIEDRAAG